MDQEPLVERGALSVVQDAGQTALAVGERTDGNDGADRHRSPAAKVSVSRARVRESSRDRMTVAAT